MAIDGLNGTKVLISDSAGALVGQGDFTVTYGGEPINVSNKSTGDWEVLLGGEIATQQIVLAGTLTYTDDVSYETQKDAAFKGIQDTYTVTFAATGETLTGVFHPHAMADTISRGVGVTTAISFSSSGEVTRTPITIVP